MAGIAYIPMLLLLIFVIALPILIGVYVYKDASRRSMNAALWTLLAIFAPGFVGLIIYLIVRSNYTDACCHKCGKPVRESFVVCPHCGASLKEHCYICNGTLEDGWANCPHCGSPIPEEQKSRISAAPKKDKGLGRLLLVLILIPIAFCILLIFLVSLFGIAKTKSSGYSYSYTTEATLEEIAETQPFIEEQLADCDAEGTGVI
ncbi:MAG: zinc ribbon domain-containing protein [Lachnospiraceae bacterium]|nr:zinc ribbon domain-containing protein [Lachnospiraceae bacterium]